MKQVKGIIFDFNGVLLWDSHLHEIAWNDFARGFEENLFQKKKSLSISMEEPIDM